MMTGRLRRAMTGRMDILASLVGWSRLGGEWRPARRRETVDAQPDSAFPDIRHDTLALAAKGLVYEASSYRYTVTPEGIAEWNRLWPEYPARCEDTASPND